jgi:hypothetical protein
VHHPNLSTIGVQRHPIPLIKVVSVERFGFGRHLPTTSQCGSCILLNKAFVSSYGQCSFKFKMDANSSNTLVTAISEAGLCRTPSHHVKWRKDHAQYPRNWSSFRKFYDTAIIVFFEFYTLSSPYIPEIRIINPIAVPWSALQGYADPKKRSGYERT